MQENWFSRIVGFDESAGPDAVRARLRVEDGRLVSDASERRPVVGALTLPSLAELRSARPTSAGEGSLAAAQGEARAMHADPANNGALIQVASQFNLLEMVSPSVTPDDGVGRYEWDHTQGPACAMAAGAATIYRNYLVPVDGGQGQSATRQLDALADLGAALAEATGLAPGELWRMRNGYALCTEEGLTAIASHLRGLADEELDDLRGRLRIGLVSDAEVTDVASGEQRVSQALCSALPIAYGSNSTHLGWEPFARLVLEASYEATLLAGLSNPHSDRVLLTAVGGGVFGNDPSWIASAITRAMGRVSGVEAVVVSYASIPAWATRISGDYPAGSLFG